MKQDGRKLNQSIQEHLRITACKRVREGESASAVIGSMGLCRTTIYRWLRKERQQGLSGLRQRKKTGRRLSLDSKEQKCLRRWVITKDPRAFGYAEALWSRRIIQSLIEKKFNVRMSLSSIGELLKRLGITPQRPLRRAYERDKEAVERWQQEEFPRIQARAKRRNALVLFLDEAGIQSDATLGSTWGERGKTPIVKTSGQRQKVNAISAVSSRGDFRYDVYTCRFNAQFFIEILKRFTKRLRRPCFFVVDGHPAHRANVVKQFISDSNGKIELYFLPPYAPDLNPDEFVWNHLKRHGLSKKPLTKNEALRTRVERDLAAIKKSPRLIRSFFRAKSVVYISA